MKNLITVLSLFLVNITLYSQDKVVLNHALKLYNEIEVSLEINKKTNDYLHLIKIDTLTITDNKGDILSVNAVENIFRKANVLARYEVDEKKKYKSLDIKGVIKYFKPTKSKNSYFDLGKIKNVRKNTNLIDISITKQNPRIFFSISDPITVEKVFPDFRYRDSNKSEKKLDFNSFDLIYAYKSDEKQDFTVAVNKEIDPGFANFTLTDKRTGIKYKLIKLKNGMSAAEKEDITIELMIENESSVDLIPFEFKKVGLREL